MPSLIVQGQNFEVSSSDYYLYWYRFIETFANLIMYFSFFPDSDNFGRRELEKGLSFLQVNLKMVGDPEIKELGTALMELMSSLQSKHHSMVADVASKLGIEQPQSPQGKQQLTRQWEKLVAVQVSTGEMEQALVALQAYTAWWGRHIHEIIKLKEQIQQRILKLCPEVIEKIGNL
jgi:hypothetical protein